MLIRGCLRNLSVLAVLWLLTMSGAAASAASLCTAVVESGWATAATEPEARDRAILWWSSRAGTLGRGYESWDRAQRKTVECETLAASRIRCRAVAVPCLPDGQLPKPRKGEKSLEL